MIDNSSQADPPHSPQALVDQLRAQILAADESSPRDDSAEPAIDGGALLSLATELGADSMLNHAVDGLLDNIDALPTRDFQIRLTDSVRSIVASRRTTLPALLEFARIHSGIAHDDLARELGISPAQLVDLETGRRPLWRARRSNPVQLVISWLEHLAIDRTDAMRATKRLVMSRPAPAFASRQNGDSEKAKQFAVRLLAALERRGPGDVSET